MFQLQPLRNPEKIKLAYKLLHDSLFILLFFFVLALIAEGLLPGIISDHFGLYKVAVLILINLFSLINLRRFIEIKIAQKNNKKIVGPLFFILALLIFNSLLKLNIYLNIFILIAVSIAGYLIFKIIQEE